MADAVEYINIPIAGVDTRTAMELVQPPKSLRLENVSYEPGGAVSKRSGFFAFPDTTVVNGTGASTLEKMRAVKAHGAELVAFDRTRLYHWISLASKWFEMQRCAFPVTRATSLMSNYGSPLLNCDVALNAGYICAAAMATPSPGVVQSSYIVTITEQSSGVVLSADTLFSDVNLDGNVKIGVYQNYFVAFWHDPTTAKIRASTFDTSNVGAGWSAAADVVATHAANFAFDIDYGAGTSGVYVAYNGAAFTSAAKITFPAGVVTVSVGPVAYTQVCDRSVTIATCTSGRLVMAYCGVNGTRARELNPTTLALIGATWTVDAAITTATSMTLCGYVEPTTALDVAYIAYSTPPTAGLHTCVTYFRKLNIAARTTSLPASASEPGVTLTHKAFVRSPAQFDGVLVGLGRADNSTELNLALYTYLDRDFTRYPVALYAYLTGFASTLLATGTSFRAISAVVQKDTDVWSWAGTRYNSFDQRGTSLVVFDMSFTADETHHALVVRDRLLIAGSVPRMVSLDARPLNVLTSSASERNALDGIVPFHPPPLFTAADGGGGGGLVAGQTYLYKQRYEYYDQDGRLHFGAATDGVSHLLGAAQTKMSVTTPAFPAPMPEYGTPQIGLYRTVGNASDLIYYRVATLPIAGGVYSDAASDASISVKETLPVGELDNFPPPPSAALCLWKNRIVALDSETGKIWPSKLMIDGEWPGFHEGLAVGTDVHDGLPVFLTSDEDKLIVWWDDAIGVVYGDPANDAGQGSTLQKPILLPQRGIGLRDRRSLVRTPIGTMFASSRGIYLLDPSLQLQFIGADVFSYSATAVVGAVLAEDQTEVRFLLSNGTVLIYDYDEQQWHVMTLVIGEGAAEFVSACMSSGTMIAATTRTTGCVWTQIFGATTDPTGAFAAVWASAYVKAQGVMGRQRVHKLWLIGQFETGFTVDVDYDFEGTYTESHTPTSTGAARQRVEIPLARHECSAVSFRVTGLKRLLPLRLEIEAEKGAARRAVTVG